jgi:serine protease
MVNVTSLWSIPPKRHVKICVVDTGYDLGHPDLPITNVTGWDPSSASFGVWNVDGNRHGTHCAGTIGAIGNNGGEFTTDIIL